MAIKTATIQVRMGLESELDISKSLPGEWLLSTDTKYIRMCVAYGIVLRMATYESFEADMSKIKELVSTAQSLKDIVMRLASEVGQKTTIVLEATEEAKKYMEEAKKYSELAFATTPDGYEVLVRDVALLKNSIVQTTDRTLYGSKEGGVKLIGVKGASEQKQYSGAQLLNYDAWKTVGIMNGTAVFENNGVTLTATARDAYTYYIKPEIEVSEGDIVTISWDLDVPYDGYVYIFANGNTIGDYTYAREKILSYQVPEGVAYVTFRVGVTNEGDTISYKNIMINKGDSALPWEPYVGGQPSPSSSYQQEIESVGDSVEVMQGCYGNTTGVYANNANYVCSKHHIPCTGGDKVKLSTKDANNLTLIYFANGAYVSYTIASSVSANEFTVPNGVTSFLFNIHKDGGITPATVGKIDLTVNGKYLLQIKQEGKNLADINTFRQLTSHDRYGYEWPNMKGGTYSIMASSESYTIYFGYMHNGVITELGSTSGSTQSRTYTFDIADGDTILCWHGSGVTTSSFKQIQLEEGEPTTYEPYHSNIITIPLNEPLREGDEIAVVDGVWGVDGKVGVYTFDGTEEFQLRNTSEDGVMTYSLDIENIIPYEQKENVYSLCTHLIFGGTVGAALEAYERGGNNTYYLYYVEGISAWYMYVNTKEYASVGDLQSALRGASLECELATPVFEPFTDQTPFYQMQSYDTVTYISTDSKVEPSIEVKFGKTEGDAINLLNYNQTNLNRIAISELTSAVLTLNQE